ncbi:MAG: exodeoxyribonuclease-3 [Verrucomicrobiales bacterium]|jgi:exodeoxyribonuclease-3
MKVIALATSFVLAFLCLPQVHAELKDARPLHILSHNVWYGFTKNPERKAQWMTWVSEQKPDILALQELNGYTHDKLQQDAKSWGHQHCALLKEEGFPTGLTSRFPITDIERIKDGFHHGLLRCKTAGFVVYVIHFHPSNWEFRIREAKLLLADVAKLTPAEQQRVILIGDFNGFSPKEKRHLEKGGELVEFFKKLDARDQSNNLNEGKLDYAGIQAFHDAGYIDLIHQRLEAKAPYPGTFPTKARPDEDMGRLRRLDYIFVTPSLARTVTSAKVIHGEASTRLSDHYPLRIELAPANTK